MKKKILLAIILGLLTTLLLSQNVFASGYDNFTKQQDYEEFVENAIYYESYTSRISYPYIVKATTKTWYYDYIKTAYELGLLKLENIMIYYEYKHYVTLEDAVSCFGNIASIYLTGNINYEYGYPVSIGLVTSEEWSAIKNDYYQKIRETAITDPNSLVLGKYVTRKDIQILTNRLFNIIDAGEQINNFTKVTDIDSVQMPSVSLEGVLQLYNLGITTGNGYGMFTPHQNVTIAEFATFISRICVPSMRQKVNAADYEKYFSMQFTPKSYKSISDEEAEKYITDNSLNKYYPSNYNELGDTLTYSNAITIIYNVIDGWYNNNDINYIYDYLKIFTRTSYPSFFTEESFNKEITKADAAIIAMYISTRYRLVGVNLTTNLKPEFISYFKPNEITYLNQALSIGLIENTEEDILKSKLTKADLSKMITILSRTFAFHCGYNVNESGSTMSFFMNDVSQAPSNANIYPYILDDIPKEVYEIMPTELNDTPAKLNKFLHYRYPHTVHYWESAFNVLLNVDYKDFSSNGRYYDFDYITYMPSNSSISEFNSKMEAYEKYVKENEIELIGDFKLLLPIVYSKKDSMLYTIRAKITFEVLHSNTNKNLLFYDENVIYTGNKFEVYVDLPCTGTLSKNLAFQHMPFDSLMTNIVYGGENITVIKE